MASYRPKIKIDSAGNTKDLPLDAETLKGNNIDYFATSKALTDLQNTVNGKQDKLNTNQLNAVNSGITQAKVTKYDGYEDLISSKPSVDNVYTKDEVNNVLAKLTRLKSNVDNRNVNTKPNDYNGWFDIKGLKNNTVINIPSGNTDYSAVLGLRGWLESSGGDAHELAFTGNGNIYHRYGATTSWNEWEKLATNKDLENKLDKDGTAVKANGIVDYAASENTIEIGYNGDTATTAEYFAVYQRNGSKIKIKDMSITNVKKVLGIPNEIYPIGSIYMSVNSTSPASIFGGSWQRLENRFLLGAGSSYSNGSTGGAATVTLTTSQIPSHNHQGLNWTNNFFTYDGATGGDTRGGWKLPGGTWMNSAANVKNFNVNNTGGGGSHNNMPPYLVVYMWKRTA